MVETDDKRVGQKITKTVVMVARTIAPQRHPLPDPWNL